MGILVVGSVAFDDVITPFGKNFNAPGGSASYFSLSASFFTKVRLVAVVGKDFPKKYIKLFNDRGIDTRGLEVKDGKTFRWKGRYDWSFDSPETLATHLNLFQHFRPTLPKDYENEKILFLANIDPCLQLEVIKQANPELIAADTIKFWIETKKKQLLKVLERIDIFIINEYEARELTKEGNLIKAGLRIISYGPSKVIIKKGEDGLLFVSKEGFFMCPAYPLEKVLDPTGAGDTFAGGFLGYLDNIGKFDNKVFKRAAVYGSIMSSFVVERYDIRGFSGLTRKKIETRVNSFRRMITF